MSVWLEQEIKKIDDRRAKFKAQKQKGLIITALVFIVLIAVIWIVGMKQPDFAAGPLCGFVTVIGIVCEFVMLVSNKTTDKKKRMPGAQESIQKLHLSPEQLQEFDCEMMSAPRFQMDTAAGSCPLRVTEHYLVISSLYLGETDYYILRLSDIAMTKVASNREGAMDKMYWIDFCGADGKKISGADIHGRKRMKEFEEAMTKYCPHIKLASH